MNLYQKNIRSISYIELFSILLLLILLVLLSRYLYPFGYEPDFWIRAPNYIYKESLNTWNAFDLNIVDYFRSYFEIIFRNLDVYSQCNNFEGSMKEHLIGNDNINSPTSIWQKIDHYTCTQGLNQILLRTLLFIILFIPFWIIFLFLIISKKHNSNFYFENLSICVAMFFPSLIYYSGVIANEQIVLALSLFLILFRNSPISLIFLSIILLIDFGNGFFVSIFLIANFIFNQIYRFTNLKIYLFVIILSIIISYIFSVHLLFYINLYFGDFLPSFFVIFTNSIIGHHYVDGLLDKYPLFIRPIITFMSFNYFTPGNIKVIPLYLYTLVFFIILLHNSIFVHLKNLDKYEKKNFIKKIVEVNNAIAIILITVFILPAYCNAKYYIFLLPIFFSLALEVYKLDKTIIFSIFANLIVLTNLAMYRF